MVDLYLRNSDKRFTVDKDVNAVLDYTWDWSDWLVAGDSITSFVLELDAPLTNVSASVVGGNRVVAFIGGGTVGSIQKATCRITTASTPPRVDDRTIYLNVIQR